MTSRPRTAHIGQIAFRGLRGFVSSESPANDSLVTDVHCDVDSSHTANLKRDDRNRQTIQTNFALELRGIMFDTILAVD